MKSFLPFKSYREWSIKIKLITMTGLLLLGSVFFESYLSYTQYTRDFHRQSSDKVQQIIEQISLNIDTYLDDLYRLTLFPYRNAHIMHALEEQTADTELAQLEKRRLMETFLDEMMIFPREDILRVSIVTDAIYSSARLPTKLIPNEEMEDYDWYKKALTSQDYILVPASENEFTTSGNIQIFSVVKQLRSITNTGRILGVIKADANYKGIVEIVERAQMGHDGGLFILDDQNNFIYSSNDTFKETALAVLHTDGEVEDGYLLNVTSIPRVAWTIVAISSVTEMNREAIHTRNQTSLLSIASALLAILLLVIFIRQFLKPLLAIVKLMKDVEMGKLDITFHSNRRDEIGYLGAAFNRLVGRIGEMLRENTVLVKEVYESKLLQQEAQINALFSQIRPHFIFNTLNLISLSMQSGKQDKAIDHIHALSSILRGMSQWNKEMPLQKEVELLHAYLAIQSSRFEGRLDYSITIHPELLSLTIPALLLQPLVENAVVHGCELKKGKTTITVTTHLKPDCILIEVNDDGPGMDSDTLHYLQQKVEQLEETGSLDRTHTGIGLVNVNKRLQVKYGTEYGLNIKSMLYEGTTVVISIPYSTAKETSHV
ncbi:sensor histidine kinase [Paenibacillus sp. GSMTC-2017]|uniref:sensor histidine kinase n=1 Tax=Paenibacillus sp. GSMTC-2017 TaxID=2794350 RepID=UPI0018D8436D|nr:sensor histidine kinase [Paenibacillus sp. GSMTC-2017]MBH5320405.1 sensor histidine kinase [Paenibacillus sp. GSMTC-2017]